MVQLDYRATNPSWGLKGIVFPSWQRYAFTLGYLTGHMRGKDAHDSSADISVRVERNERQGAWAKEGRIHFHGTEERLRNVLPELDSASSAGTGAVTRRVNSTKYVLSLIDDYGFKTSTRDGQSTARLQPAPRDMVKQRLAVYLEEEGLTEGEIAGCLGSFEDGYSYP